MTGCCTSSWIFAAIPQHMPLRDVITCFHLNSVLNLKHPGPTFATSPITSSTHAMNTLQPRSSSHHRVASSSSYAPILINPSGPSFPSSTPSSAPSSARLPLEPRIRYPYPLPFFTLIDLAYTFHHDRGRSVSSMSFTLCIARAVVLGIVLGCSTRWRNRGGWIGAVSGCSIGYAVWSVCEAQLTKGKGTSGAEEPVQALFLGIVRFPRSLLLLSSDLLRTVLTVDCRNIRFGVYHLSPSTPSLTSTPPPQPARVAFTAFSRSASYRVRFRRRERLRIRDDFPCFYQANSSQVFKPAYFCPSK